MTTTITYELEHITDAEKRDIQTFANLPPETMKGVTGDDDCFAVWEVRDGTAAGDDPWSIADAIGAGRRLIDAEGELTLSASQDWRRPETKGETGTTV